MVIIFRAILNDSRNKLGTLGSNITLVGLATPCGCPTSVKALSGMRLIYEFRNGKYVYLVTEEGRLIVSENKKDIVNEIGKWNY